MHQGSDTNDDTVKIKHATVKKENDEYYAIFNIEEIYAPKPIIGPNNKWELILDVAN